jgi:hypothetical protein
MTTLRDTEVIAEVSKAPLSIDSGVIHLKRI